MSRLSKRCKFFSRRRKRLTRSTLMVWCPARKSQRQKARHLENGVATSPWHFRLQIKGISERGYEAKCQIHTRGLWLHARSGDLPAWVAFICRVLVVQAVFAQVDPSGGFSLLICVLVRECGGLAYPLNEIQMEPESSLLFGCFCCPEVHSSPG